MFSTIEEVSDEEKTDDDTKPPDKNEGMHPQDIGANGDDETKDEPVESDVLKTKTTAETEDLATKEEPNGIIISF